MLPDCRGGSGARKMIYVNRMKTASHTADPRKILSCEFIARISVQELLARDLDDLIVDIAPCFEFMVRARHVREIQFINDSSRDN